MTIDSTRNTLLVYPVLLFIIAGALLTASCGKKEEPVAGKNDTAKKVAGKESSEMQNPGKELFYAKSKENNIACADCHSDGSNLQNPLTKFFSDVIGANKRSATYHGKFKEAEVAANAGGATVCWEAYMKMKTPLTSEQIASLNEYYGSLKGTGDQPSEIKYETIALPEKDKAKLKEAQKKISALTGDPAAGESKFNEACGICHGDKKTVRKVPDLFDDFDGNVKSITYNVRFGDGAMPFYKEAALSNQDVADIAAFILKKNSK